MKMLNLDDLAPEERVLKLRGQEYQMREMTVSDFIEATREAERAQTEANGADIPMSETVEKLVEIINKNFPDCPCDVLKTLSLAQLTAILEFMRGDQAEKAQDQSQDKVSSEGNA